MLRLKRVASTHTLTLLAYGYATYMAWLFAALWK